MHPANFPAILGRHPLCVLAVVLDETRADTFGQLWNYIKDNAGYAVAVAMAIYYIYQLTKRLDKAESEIKWLDDMLKVVKTHAEDMRKGSIENIVQLEERLDRLESWRRRG